LLFRIAMLAIAAPRRIIAIALLVTVAAAIFGVPVANSLSASGFGDPNSESSRATQLLADQFGRSGNQMVITVAAPDGVTSPAARKVGTDIASRLSGSPYATNTTSAWTAPPATAAQLVSRDGKTGLIVADITGGENDAMKHARTLSDQLVPDAPVQPGDVTVRAGGVAMVNAQITSQSQRDLLLMEAIAIPFSFLVLVWVFGGLVAAALPVGVGAMAIVGSMSVLRFITLGTDVSIFALNLSTAMGLALAIDYTLLIISRYRDELAGGADPDGALVRTVMTAGRTVLFSATTVALSMAAMIVFPMHFLKSFAYAGVATVGFAALAALVVAPAAIALLGPRLDALDVRRPVRHLLKRPGPMPRPLQQMFWYRWAKRVMRRAVPIGVAVVALLLLLGAPFLGVRWGFPDDRVLPTSASAHQVGDQLRNDFADDSATAVTAVIPDANGLAPSDLERYAADLSRVSDVSSVSAPTGTFVGGARVGPPTAPAGEARGSAFVTISTSVPLFTAASETQLDQLHSVPKPGDRGVDFTGTAQVNRDSVNAITSRLPLALALIAAITFVLLFLLTGSVVLPLKALVLNVLSLSAAFGALVWIFQDGHLGALGTTSTGTLVANMPVLLFCIAFGLSMDYEVFLIARIREYWLAPESRADNDESVALGLARTGRVITAAALVMSISFAALIAAQAQVMRLFGLGLTLAVVVDATLVRMVLVPAFMHVMGKWNWWAPKPLKWLHGRIGIEEDPRPLAFGSGPERHSTKSVWLLRSTIEPNGSRFRVD
jgi:RND superfamily putative drug exporter